MKSGRKHTAIPYSHGFDCRNSRNCDPLVPFPYRIYNSPLPLCIFIHILDSYASIQGVPGGMDKTSGECSLC